VSDMKDRVDRLRADPEERCDFSDLIKDQCDHCRQQQRRDRRFKFLTLTDDELSEDSGDWTPEITGYFPARAAGRCARCNARYPEGTWISKTVDGDYLCPCT
jgi:hypothetical protein